jgi:tRNA dimethylallyltransferase
MHGVTHHLFDVLNPSDEASVADYQALARQTIDDVHGRGAAAILVGGSGLYVSSVLWDFRFPGTDPDIRARWEAELEQSGPGMLHRKLKELDSDAAAAIGSSNGRRLVRALEVIELTGEKFGSGLPDEESLWKPATLIGVHTPRDELVERLDSRVRTMWSVGLLDEVASIGHENMGVTAARAIGYAQAIAQLEGRMTETDAIEATAALTRKYARRQVGWFKRYPNVTWLDSDREHTDHDHRVDVAVDSITR